MTFIYVHPSGYVDYQRADQLLAMIWTDKRDVKLTSTLHVATMVDTGKVNLTTNEPIIKLVLAMLLLMSNVYADKRKTCK